MQERILWCMPQGQISLVDGNLSETRLGFETVMSSDARETSMDASKESPRSPFGNQELASTAQEPSKEGLREPPILAFGELDSPSPYADHAKRNFSTNSSRDFDLAISTS